MKLKKIVKILFGILLVSTPSFSQNIGDVISPWKTGELDIHFINTGKGEACFYIFPDGTTMLVDAGATSRTGRRVTEIRPDSSHTPGEWIVRYIKNLPGNESISFLDYVLLTHFHDDHIGRVTENSTYSSSKMYQLSGVTQVGEDLIMKKIIDRGWPDYDYPYPLENHNMTNYQTFLKWQIANNQTVVERFKPGRDDQIVLVNRPEEFNDFEIRNIAVNGVIWTGVDSETRNHFPALEDIGPDEFPSENMCSIAFRLSYGKFDFFNGGDITGVLDDGAPLWHDVETPVARAVGPVEVNVLNHHGYLDTENAFFLSALRPQVHIIQAWSPSHPSPRVLRRLLSEKIYPGPRDIFATNIMEANKIVIGSGLEKLKSDQGHIVVRVAPTGSTFKVIILDDSTESYRIKDVFGPYESK